MIKDLLKENVTLRYMLLGILVSNVIIEILLLIFTENKFYNSSGLIIGMLAAMGMAIHMAWSIEVSLSLDEKSANVYMRKYTVIRYVIVCAILAIVGYFDLVSPVTYVFGLLTLKTGTYMYPLFNRIFNK